MNCLTFMLRIVLDTDQELLYLLERAFNTARVRKNTIGHPRRKVGGGGGGHAFTESWQGSDFWGICPLPASAVLTVGQRDAQGVGFCCFKLVVFEWRMVSLSF